MNTDEILEEHEKGVIGAEHLLHNGKVLACRDALADAHIRARKAIETEKKQAVIEALEEVRTRFRQSTSQYQGIIDQKIKALKGE